MEIKTPALRNQGIWSKAKGHIAAAGGAVSALALLASNALATETVADLMGQADITGAKTAVYTFLVGLVFIGVLFFGRRLLRKMGVSV